MKIKVCLLSCLFVSGLVGCSGTSDEACSAVAELSGQEVALTSACAGVDLTFAPQVQLDGVWTSADEAASLGTLNVALEDGKLVTSFTARADAAVGGLRLVGTGVINGRTGWLSNGFQSWSHSGMLALNGGSSEAELLKALTDEGDEEVLREGRALSWWHSAIGSATGGAVVTGVTEVARWRSWVKAVTPSSSEADALELWLVCGGAGESVLLAAGEQVHSEPWVLSAGNDVQALQRSYAAQVVSRERPAGVHAELGWNSWYDLWDKVGAQDVLDNAALAKTILEDEGQVGGAPLRIVVDDGWQQKWGVWETNAKFPDGLDGLATTLKAEGYHMGVWLAPLLVDPTSALAQNHPEWLVDGAAFLHPVHGALQVLDVTHPEAAAHLTRVIQTIVGWGYDLLKIDFLFAGTFQGGRYEPMPGMQAYAKAMDLMRDAAGEDVVLLAVGAPGVPSLKWVDSWRLGPDIAWEPTDANWHFIPAQARNVAARWHLCERTLCDADPVLLRGLPQNEVNVGAWVAAMAGGAFFLSDDLRDVEAERSAWGVDPARVALGIGEVPAVPQDIFIDNPPRTLASIINDIVRGDTSHALPSRWRLPSGELLRVNWFETAQTDAAGGLDARTAVVSAD